MNDDTMLYRQVHHSHVEKDRIHSLVFLPAKGSGELSVYDGDQMAAEDSWNHYTHSLGNDSVGVVAVTVEECSGLGLRVVPDPNEFQEHALILFEDIEGNQLSRNQIEKTAKRLRGLAERRGWQYRPGTTP